MAFILAKKLGTSQSFQKNGTLLPVTLLAAGPCKVVQVKTQENDGYTAVQLGFGEKRVKNIKKPQLGQMKDLGHFRFLREFRVDDPAKFKRGDEISVSVFKPGDKIEAEGISKGRGFAGVIKRHKFSRGPETHGSRHHREPGAIGSGFPQHVPRGTRLPGHMGNIQVTVKNLEVVDVLEKDNLIAIKGAVPGHRGGLVLISSLKKKERKKDER